MKPLTQKRVRDIEPFHCSFFHFHFLKSAHSFFVLFLYTYEGGSTSVCFPVFEPWTRLGRRHEFWAQARVLRVRDSVLWREDACARTRRLGNRTFTTPAVPSSFHWICLFVPPILGGRGGGTGSFTWKLHCVFFGFLFSHFQGISLCLKCLCSNFFFKFCNGSWVVCERERLEACRLWTDLGPDWSTVTSPSVSRERSFCMWFVCHLGQRDLFTSVFLLFCFVFLNVMHCIVFGFICFEGVQNTVNGTSATFFSASVGFTVLPSLIKLDQTIQMDNV